jgi:hypothetical protein
MEPVILLDRIRRRGPHVGFILGEQGMHQTHKLAGSEDEGAFVLVLGYLRSLSLGYHTLRN